eukprot:6965349-Prymnesium_polylepis.1
MEHVPPAQSASMATSRGSSSISASGDGGRASPAVSGGGAETTSSAVLVRTGSWAESGGGAEAISSAALIRTTSSATTRLSLQRRPRGTSTIATSGN